MGMFTIFHWVRSAENFPIFYRGVFSTFHQQRKPRAQNVWFQFFREVSVYGKDIIHKRIVSMIPFFFREERVVFLPGPFISIFVFTDQKFSKQLKLTQKSR